MTSVPNSARLPDSDTLVRRMHCSATAILLCEFLSGLYAHKVGRERSLAFKHLICVGPFARFCTHSHAHIYVLVGTRGIVWMCSI